MSRVPFLAGCMLPAGPSTTCITSQATPEGSDSSDQQCGCGCTLRFFLLSQEKLLGVSTYLCRCPCPHSLRGTRAGC